MPVSSTNLVTNERNRYSVPCAFANQKVSLRLYPEGIEIHAEDSLVATHARSFERGQVIYDWQHYLPRLERKPGALRNGAPFEGLPAPLQQLRTLLVKRPGGDRLMADILAHVPRHGLENVRVAVELILEPGAPSAEHVKNVLARLRQAPPPAPLDTALVVTGADCRRRPLRPSARGERSCVRSSPN